MQRQAPPPWPACGVCSGPLTDAGWCDNRLCDDPHCSIACIHAIATSTGSVSEVTRAWKYKPRHAGWATVLGRLVLGWLEAHAAPGSWDVIVANPTHPARVVRHTEDLVAAAAAQDADRKWPFDRERLPLLVKTAETPQSARGRYPAKLDAAIAHAAAVEVTRPELVAGARVLVVDDVATTGLQLDHLARRLLLAGAAEVEGLVLARAVSGV